LPNGVGEYIWGDGNSPNSGGAGAVATGGGGTSASQASGANISQSKLLMQKQQQCNFYRGRFLNGWRHGTGTFFYANGSQYTGQWDSNQKHGEGVYVFPDGRIYAGLFYKDRIDESAIQSVPHNTILNPKASEDVNPQYRLNIDDVVDRFAQFMNNNSTNNEGDIPNFMLLKHQTKEIERLILRFNAVFKLCFKRLSDISNRRRGRENTDPLHLTGIDKTATKGWSKVELLMYASRSFYRKFYGSTIFQLKKLLRELTIMDGFYLNSYDISLIIDDMKASHLQTALLRQFDYRKNLFNSANTNSEGNVAEEPTTVPAVLLFPTDIGAAKIGNAMDNIFGDSSLESNVNDIKLPLVNPPYSDPRYPLLDREFVEIFVRAIAENYMKKLSIDPKAKSYRNISLFNVVYKILAEKVSSNSLFITYL